MDYIRFLIACCVSFHAVSAFSEEFLKRLAHPGILETLKKPKIPGISLQLGGNKQGFGFGFGFNLGKGVVVAPEEPKLPDLKPEAPKPQPPWDKDKGPANTKPRPNWEEYEEHKAKPRPYEGEEAKPRPYEGDEAKPRPVEDAELPDWSDIGETENIEEHDFEKKSERFNSGDLTGTGLIQPRLNRGRGRRAVESPVYHVPLLFRSNAKPFRVKVNALAKDH